MNNDDLGTGVINEHDYDDDEYTEASNQMSSEGSELIDHLWVSGAPLRCVADDLTSALHNSCIPGALDLVVRIEKKA
jgi:hypothetical protein